MVSASSTPADTCGNTFPNLLAIGKLGNLPPHGIRQLYAGGHMWHATWYPPALRRRTHVATSFLTSDTGFGCRVGRVFETHRGVTRLPVGLEDSTHPTKSFR